MNKSFAKMFEESQKNLKMFPGAIIKAKVIDINNEFVTLYSGLKSESIIPAEQFHNRPFLPFTVIACRVPLRNLRCCPGKNNRLEIDREPISGFDGDGKTDGQDGWDGDHSFW